MARGQGQREAVKAQSSDGASSSLQADGDPETVPGYGASQRAAHATDAAPSHSEGTTDYEDLRRRNMARNAAFLASVGLLNPATLPPRPSVRSAAKRSRREEVAEGDAAGDAAAPAPLRRSTRVATLSHVPNYAEPRLEEPRGSLSPRRSSLRASSMRAFNSLWASGSPGGSGMAPGEDHAEGEEEGRALSLSLSEVKQAAGPEIVASSMRKIRDMDANIAYFLSEGVLGVRLRDANKAPVVALAAGAGSAGGCPGFNKYSGVAEWRNAIFIWVNVPSGGSGAEDYPNEFFEDGRYMSWFGGSRMHADSPVVQRLLSASSVKDEGARGSDHGCTVLLLVRVDTEPYTCLGRVRAQSADLARHPVAVRWELIDRHRLSLVRDSASSGSSTDIDDGYGYGYDNDDGEGARKKGESDFGRILRLVDRQSAARKK